MNPDITENTPTNTTTTQQAMCLHCSTPFEGNFCPQCGQKATVKRFDLKAILGQLPSQIFQLEKGILLTFRDLIIRPGVMIRGYLSGKRATYTHPVNYWLFLVAIAAFISIPFLEPFMNNMGLYNKAARNGFIKTFIVLMKDHYTLFIGFTLPFYAAGTYICYRKVRYNYAEHLVINLYILAQQTLLATVLLPFQTTISPKLIVVSSLLQYVYVFWAFWQIFELKHWWSKIWRAILSIVLSFILLELFILIFTALFFFLYSTINHEGFVELMNLLKGTTKK